MNNNLYPITFEPVYKDYIWGGSRIPETFNRDVPEGVYAESWEITDHVDGMSVVTNGPLKGSSLRDLIEKQGKKLLGSRVKDDRFPLLIKLIDAKQKLSVQVHPNDENQDAVGGEAKTEMWYMLGDNKTKLYCGLKEGVTKESFLKAVEDGTSGETLQSIPVQKNDAVFVPGGRVHAIDEECLILEIQQNSNTTYRLYDWGRVGADGKPRDLHIEKATEVITWDDSESPLATPRTLISEPELEIEEVLRCPYFTLEKITFSKAFETTLTGESFHALFVAEGEATICWSEGEATYPAGTSILIPAALPHYTLKGKANVLRTTVPE